MQEQHPMRRGVADIIATPGFDRVGDFTAVAILVGALARIRQDRR